MFGEIETKEYYHQSDADLEYKKVYERLGWCYLMAK